MIANQFWSRKRRREEAEQCIRGFGEHRMKRQNSANSQQVFTNMNLLSIQNPSFYDAELNWPPPCEISPKSKDPMMNSLQIRSERCLISQVSSPSTGTSSQISSISPSCDSVESSPGLYTTRDTKNSLLRGTKKYDTIHLSPRLVYHDVSTTAFGRIPTPIYRSFTSFKKDDSFDENINHVKSENVFKRVNRVTKLHSPISEENMSPSIIVTGLSDMQMSLENSFQDNCGRKGENKTISLQSRPNSNSMTKYLSGNPSSDEIKKSFSMGYRANCEKCKIKVPGHFGHIIIS